MEQPVRVRILDHEYLVRSDEGEKQVQRVAEFVNERFREVKDNTQGLSETKTAILVAFHIAGEYLQILEDRDNLAKEVQERARALNMQIESVIR